MCTILIYTHTHVYEHKEAYTHTDRERVRSLGASTQRRYEDESRDNENNSVPCFDLFVKYS